ncbi:MAG: hypothetical protein AABX89_07365 [Candidatus Thermoplasmatota archaeon]
MKDALGDIAGEQPEASQAEALANHMAQSEPETKRDLLATLQARLETAEVQGAEREIMALYLADVSRGQDLNVLVANYQHPNDAPILGYLAAMGPPEVAYYARARLVASSRLGDIPRSFAEALKTPAAPKPQLPKSGFGALLGGTK